MSRVRTYLLRSRQTLDAVIEDWIGYALPPIARVAREREWVADARSAYCGRCGSSVGRGEVTRDGCASCRGRPAPLDAVVRLGAYRGQLRAWILDVKFRHRWIEMGRHLGELLGEAVLAAGVVDPARTVVVPMPMPWQRRLYRGIDHAQTISAGVSSRLGAPVRPLLRKANGPTQAGRRASARRRSAACGLALAPAWAGPRRVAPPARATVLAGRDVLLVDDVATTGASARAAARLLRTLGPRCVVAAVVAVADERGRLAPRYERLLGHDDPGPAGGPKALTRASPAPSSLPDPPGRIRAAGPSPPPEGNCPD